MKNRVRAVVLKGNELLLVKHKLPNGTVSNSWVLPGGKIDEGELITDAIRREMMEETGVEPAVGRLLYVHQFIRDGRGEGPEFFFHIENATDYDSIDLSQTSHGREEIAEIGFYDPRTLDSVLPGFLVKVAEQGLPQHTEVVIRDQEQDN